MSERPGMPKSYDEDLSREPGDWPEGGCKACGCDGASERTLGTHGGAACINPYCPCSEEKETPDGS